VTSRKIMCPQKHPRARARTHTHTHTQTYIHLYLDAKLAYVNKSMLRGINVQSL